MAKGACRTIVRSFARTLSSCWGSRLSGSTSRRSDTLYACALPSITDFSNGTKCFLSKTPVRFAVFSSKST